MRFSRSLSLSYRSSLSPAAHPSRLSALRRSPSLALYVSRSLAEVEEKPYRDGPSEQLAEVEEKPYHDRTSAFCEIRKMELGLSQSTDFARRAGGSEVEFHFSFCLIAGFSSKIGSRNRVGFGNLV